jgi:hypothetical protein
VALALLHGGRSAAPEIIALRMLAQRDQNHRRQAHAPEQRLRRVGESTV